jgi:CBS domain-containing protein
MATVSQLLAIKGQTVHAIGRMATVFEAIERMVAHGCGALLVMEGTVMEGTAMEGSVTDGVSMQGSVMGMRPCGMVTERDYLSKVALQGRASRTTLVEEIMTKGLVSVHPDSSIESCMDLMTRKRIRHLPVFDGVALAGLVSIGDIVKYLARDRQSQIEQLTAYIQGGEMAHA